VRVFVHAPNIHQGGGRTLLTALLAALSGQGCVAIVDERLYGSGGDFPADLEVVRVTPSVAGRLRAEVYLRQSVRCGDVVLCFGNLPPLFHLRAAVKVYIQNRYLVSRRGLVGMPWAVRLRIHVERVWLRLFLRGAEVLVQTPSMASEVRAVLGVPARVLPFARREPVSVQPAGDEGRFDFLYVASGEPHKNHRLLLEAWCLLADAGLFPSLCLTLDPVRDRRLVADIESTASARGLQISNAGHVSASPVRLLYLRSNALVYPSLFESLGLPLTEATQAGLALVAAERDYVRDIADPAETFDPDSARSIARAVRRYLGKPEALLVIPDPAHVVDYLLGKV